MKLYYCLDCNKEKSKKGNYCKKCGYKHRSRPSGLVYSKHKENPTSFKKGIIPWNKGVMLNNLSPAWKGDDVKYDAIHDWVERWLGKPMFCEICKNGCRKIYHWSNKSGKYLRDLSDWQRLCVKCHSRYDYEIFGARKVFYEH